MGKHTRFNMPKVGLAMCLPLLLFMMIMLATAARIDKEMTNSDEQWQRQANVMI